MQQNARVLQHQSRQVPLKESTTSPGTERDIKNDGVAKPLWIFRTDVDYKLSEPRAPSLAQPHITISKKEKRTLNSYFAQNMKIKIKNSNT